MMLMALTLSVPLALGAQEAAAPASASPELVGQLTDQLKITPQQAEGAAGALFGLAKTKLSADDFGKVAGAVPGMDSLLKAAPALDPKASAVAALAGSAGGIASLAGSFSKLGLSPDMALKAVPILTDFVGKKGGAEVGKLLAGVLK
jgi:hypothetical protein